ncbi:FxSxx-COOH system tetratricopeptide repeat protein [Pseudofrankia sp. BMG5.37]|nr:FxSxx-COOH system tetratricopeptide repeat protein [Pseudofrankia sp. BMG5.37]
MAGSGRPSPGEIADRVDFFVSHAGPDSDWAEWVAATLENAGYSVELDMWDWTAGTSVVTAANRALRRAGRVLVLASPDYFAHSATSAQFDAAFIRQQQELEGALVPVLVRRCTPDEYPPLLKPLLSIDLTDLDETAAKARLLKQLATPRHPPTGTMVPFPSRTTSSTTGDAATAPTVVFPGRLPPVWGPVPARNLFFTGREGLLAELHDRLAAGPVAMTALQGFGGVGKTQLAVEYVWRYAGDFGLVWWVDAETSTALTSGLAALATVLGIGAGDLANRAAAARAELGRRQDWLLVYDNAADPAALAALLPPTSGRLIVTCRDEGLRRVVADVLGVGEFAREESIQLLHRHVPELPEHDAHQLAEALGNLPLAIDQAGAFLATTGMDTVTYLQVLADQPRSLLAQDTPHHPGLAATVSAAYTRLAAEQPLAAALLRVLAFLASEPIPLAARPLSNVTPVPGALLVADALTTHTAVAAISRFALARRTGAALRIHQLVQALLRAHVPAEQAHDVFAAALNLLGTVVQGDAGDPAAWPAYATLTPHVAAAAERLSATECPPEPDRFRWLLIYTCWYLVHSGQSHAARPLLEPAQSRWRTALGPDHPDSLAAATALAAVLDALGELQAARELDEDTLARRQRLFGDEHPDTLASTNNLANRLSKLGDYPAARKLNEDVVARMRRLHGDDHPDTLGAAHNLAATLSDLGDHRTARSLDEDTWTRRRQTLGDDHPVTLASANNLAKDLAALGDHQAARELGEDTLERRRRVLGADHPETLSTASNLAIWLARLGDLEAARDLTEETWARQRRLLGDDHPATLGSAANLAIRRSELGQHTEARALAEDTLARRRRVLGHDHPETLNSANNLALDLATAGENQSAQELLKDTVTRQRRVLGPDHPSTRQSERILRRLTERTRPH